MRKKNGVNHSMSSGVVKRRRNALNRLESQLKSGLKPVKDSEDVALTESDVKRINKEIEILKSKI